MLGEGGALLRSTTTEGVSVEKCLSFFTIKNVIWIYVFQLNVKGVCFLQSACVHICFVMLLYSGCVYSFCG